MCKTMLDDFDTIQIIAKQFQNTLERRLTFEPYQ